MNTQDLKEFENNFFKFESEEKKKYQSMTDSEINEKYLKGEVRIVTEQARYPLNTIQEVFSGEDYILNPEFQRRHRWNVEKQSKLIESFIMNVPIPPIFLYETEYSVYEVMDGLQRISAIKDFYEDKYALQGLEIWPELNGRTYSKLPEQIKKGIDRRYISSIVLLKETTKTKDEANTIKQMVFSRINSGGAKLEDQEYRNSQCSGEFKNMIIDLARNSYFCEIFDIPQKTDNENLAEDKISDDLRDDPKFKTMKDVEIVLRFFALRNIDKWKDTTFTRFLDQFAYKADSLKDNNVLTAYKNIFEETIKFAYELLEDKAFCMWKKNKDGEYKWGKKATMVIYDALMYVLSNYLNKKEIFISRKDDVMKGFEKLFEEYESEFNGRNTTPRDIQKRINIFDTFLQNFNIHP